MKYEGKYRATNDMSSFWFEWEGVYMYTLSNTINHAHWLLFADTFRFITLIDNISEFEISDDNLYPFAFTVWNYGLYIKHWTHKGCDLALGEFNRRGYAFSLVDSREFRSVTGFSVGRILFNWLVLTVVRSVKINSRCYI